MGSKQTDPTARFWCHVKKTDSCWLWIRGTNKRGYGQFNSGVTKGYKNTRAHRYSWELVNGVIPEDLQVLHKCHNPKCVNPEHLYLGTHRQNMDDRIRRNRYGV